MVMGGIHATMRRHEAAQHVDAVVTGEAETIWPQLLADFGRGAFAAALRGRSGGPEPVPAGPPTTCCPASIASASSRPRAAAR